MNSAMTQEGYIKFRNYRTWYRIVGKGDSLCKYPLICLHGGPGAPHDYLKSLEEIAKTGRRVIFYDQLGCGNSDCPADDNLWTLDLFKDELIALLEGLKIYRYHLLGQSWGGILALEHALDKPKGLQSLILASATASVSQGIDETNRLRRELPQTIQDVLSKHEANGTTKSSEYEEAIMRFNQLHLCRLSPWPEELKRSFSKANFLIYQKMFGPNEFASTGVLKDWDVRNRLSEINVPTLITSGKYDEATPLVSKAIHDGITNSKWELFENSSHLAHMEEPGLYIKTLNEFISEVES